MGDDSKKLVSVIIPTYGRAETLDVAIESVVKQNYKNIEIIVVDDNSEESPGRIFTEEMMQKYQNINQVRYYRHHVNQGVSAARNTGIKNAAGEYVAFLDDDDRYLPEYIGKMLQRILETSSDMVYMGKAYCDDGKRIYASKAGLEYYPEGYIFKDVLGAKCPISIFFMAKKVVLEKVGMFDLEMRGFEDGDMWFSISQIGKVAAVNDIEAIYTRDEKERLTKNPYKWENDLKLFKEKWDKRLSGEEKQIFQEFITFHRNQNKLNMIFWELLEKKKTNISFKECLKTNISKSIKIRLILVKLLGNRGDRVYTWLRLSLCRNRFVFWEG